MQEGRGMDQRSWQWLYAICAVVGSILFFVAVLNRNRALAVVFGALTLGALLFVMLGYQRYVKEHGEEPPSPRRRAWGIGFNVFALIYYAVVGPVAAVTGHPVLVVSALSTGGPVRIPTRASPSGRPVTSQSDEHRPEGKARRQERTAVACGRDGARRRSTTAAGSTRRQPRTTPEAHHMTREPSSRT